MKKLKQISNKFHSPLPLCVIRISFQLFPFRGENFPHRKSREFMMKLILKSQLNTDEIIRQMRNKQLDKFAFMVVLLFHRFSFECFIRAAALIMWCWELFFGFSVTFIELDVIALRSGRKPMEMWNL
jgi:hypothetical protein